MEKTSRVFVAPGYVSTPETAPMIDPSPLVRICLDRNICGIETIIRIIGGLKPRAEPYSYCQNI